MEYFNHNDNMYKYKTFLQKVRFDVIIFIAKTYQP